MTAVFYVAAAIAILSTVLAITRLSAVHGLLYFVVSLLAIAVIFYVLGAPFVAALEVILYAGAIVVLFVFVVMLLNQGLETLRTEQQWLSPKKWIGPAALALVLAAELGYIVVHPNRLYTGTAAIGPRQVALALYGPYVIGVELASFLLLAGLVGAYHLGRRTPSQLEIRYGTHSTESRVHPGGDLVRVGTERDSGAS